MFETKFHSADLSQLSFLVTGGAGFIGSHIAEYLLINGAKKVRVLDNFATGSRQNLSSFLNYPSFELIEGDIRDFETCTQATKGVDYVSHQAAIGSVPRSIDDPLTSNAVNISGFLNMIYACKINSGIRRFVYAASSSTYGDSAELPKVEERIGKPLSPYAVTKYVNELYADVFARTYGIETIGLRYFNVFGPRQSPDGAYAAVIPLFVQAARKEKPVYINGDGEQTRDFTYIQNVIQANIKALFVTEAKAVNQVYNIACGQNISLNSLWKVIKDISGTKVEPSYRAERAGDIKHSLASIDKARELLGYEPVRDLEKQLAEILK